MLSDEIRSNGIELVDLDFGYRSSLLFSSISVNFAPGQVTGLAGQSGSGKSTLLYIAGLLLTPRAGRIRVGDLDLAGVSDGIRSSVRANHIGFVFQDALLDPTNTVLGNVLESALYCANDRRRMESTAVSLLEQFGVSLRLHHRPGEVSGGQAQRVSLCRALLTAPALVLADEPTGNLDAETAAIVTRELRNHADLGNVVVIASHDDDTLAACDEVVYLRAKTE